MEGFEENSVQKPYRVEDKREPQQQQEQQQTEVGLGFHSSPPPPCTHPNLDPAPPPYDLDKQSMNEEELRNQKSVDEEPLTQQTINEELQNQGILNEELRNLALGEEGTADTDHGEEDGNGEGCKRNEIDANHEEVFNEEEDVKEEDEVADSPDDKNLDEDINDDTHLDDHDNGRTENDEEGVEGTENVGEDSEFPLASKDGRYRRYYYPLRPDAEDCSYYMRTGTCKFGSNCKFNHPLRRRNQAAKEKVKENEENPERTGQIECKYYLTSGGCKFGKACRYNHSQGKILASPVLELNFLGLPIRPGEKECPYYMRNGSCKYGSNCRFNHPDPTTVGGDTSGYENGGSVSLQGSSQSPMPSWSSPRTLNETAPFVPMMLSPNQGIPSPSSEWNGYQAPVYPATERSLPTPPAFAMNNPVNETNFYSHHQLQVVVDEFPERPGQPECSYFLKTGDCKFRSGCKFHHPKNRNLKAPACTLSDKGLPLRPDQNICMHYSRYGICKFGPACKFDHPVNYANSASSVGSEPDHPPFGNYAGSGNGN